MYRNIKKYEIKFTDVDAYDNLKPSALLSFLEESACLSADELGFGYDAIKLKGLGFIIVNYYIEMYRAVKLGEVVEVHTWPIRPKHFIFFRDFELYCGGLKVGVATTRWCMINTDTFSIAPVSAFFAEGDFDNYNTERSVNFGYWKIPAIEEGVVCRSKLVAFSDYDHYFHVNNTKYADMMLDTFSPEEFAGKYIGKMQITYVKQCKLGEIIDFYRESEGNCHIVEGKVGSELRVQFKVELNEV